MGNLNELTLRWLVFHNPYRWRCIDAALRMMEDTSLTTLAIVDFVKA